MHTWGLEQPSVWRVPRQGDGAHHARLPPETNNITIYIKKYAIVTHTLFSKADW
jgi:hypothetical protein